MSASAVLLAKEKRPIGVRARTVADEEPDPCSYPQPSSIVIEPETFRYTYGTDKRSEVSDHALYGGHLGGPTRDVTTEVQGAAAVEAGVTMSLARASDLVCAAIDSLQYAPAPDYLLITS